MPHMQDDFPLLMSTLYDHAVWIHPDQEIVSVESDRSVRRTSYAETDVRVRKLATALDRLGLEIGDAVGDLRLEQPASPRALLGDSQHRTRLSHHQSAAVRRPDRLHRQSRRRQGDIRRSRPRSSDCTTRRQVRVRGAFRRHGELRHRTIFPGSVAYEDLIADPDPSMAPGLSLTSDLQ